MPGDPAGLGMVTPLQGSRRARRIRPEIESGRASRPAAARPEPPVFPHAVNPAATLDLSDPMLSPCRFLSGPANAPRTVCSCQRIAATISAIVTPSARPSMPTSSACLVPSRALPARPSGRPGGVLGRNAACRSLRAFAAPAATKWHCRPRCRVVETGGRHPQQDAAAVVGVAPQRRGARDRGVLSHLSLRPDRMRLGHLRPRVGLTGDPRKSESATPFHVDGPDRRMSSFHPVIWNGAERPNPIISMQ